jgi:PAS domain-containing protein
LTRRKSFGDASAAVAAFEHALLPVFLLDPDGQVRWENDRMRALTGATTGGGIGDRWFSGPPEVAKALPAVLASGEVCEFSLAVSDRLGRMRTLQFSAMPVERGLALVAVFGLQ